MRRELFVTGSSQRRANLTRIQRVAGAVTFAGLWVLLLPLVYWMVQSLSLPAWCLLLGAGLVALLAGLVARRIEDCLAKNGVPWPPQNRHTVWNSWRR